MDAGLGLVVIMLTGTVGASLTTLLVHWRQLDAPRKWVLIVCIVSCTVAAAVIFPMWEASLYG